VFVRFNPTVQNNRQQKTNFKALPISKITSNAAEADMFATAALSDGFYNKAKIIKDNENIGDLLKAIQQAPDAEILSHLEDVAKVWIQGYKPKQ